MSVRRILAVALVAAALGVGCKRGPSPEPSPGAPHFVENDLAAATAQAKREKKLVFVDAWAPWCHTCLSLREYVLHDPAVAKLSDRYVFVSLDTERDVAEPFLRKHPMKFWPTLWVLDPDTDQALLKWPGSLTVPELTDLLSGVARDRAAGGAMGDLVKADRALAQGEVAAAIAGYDAARKAAAPGSAAHARATDALVTALQDEDPSRCVEVAEAEAARLPKGTNAVNVVVMGLSCVEKAKRESAELARLGEALVGDATLPLLDDDRSSLYESLVELHDRRKDDEKAKALAAAWATFLEGRAAAAPNDRARAVFDAHRMLAYVKLGRLEDARVMLERSEALFPDDSNPPARLMRVLRAQKKLDLAEAAGRRAMQKVYGPRTLSVAEGLAAVLRDRGDPTAEKKLLEEALGRVSAREVKGSTAKSKARLEARLAELSK